MNDDERSIESRLGALGDALNDALDQRPIEPSDGRRAPRPTHRLMAVAAAALVIAGGAGIWAVSTGGDDDPDATGGQVQSTPPSTTTPGGTITTVPPITVAVVDATSTVVPVTTLPADEPVATPPTTSFFASQTFGASPALAVGDYVMTGATDALERHGFVVDAREEASAGEMVDAVAQRVDDLQPEVVVVHINGPMTAEEAEALMAAVDDVPRVVVLTMAVTSSPWKGELNELIESLPAQYPNVVVLPWDALAPACPGDCFDDVNNEHLGSDGARYYAGLIALVAGVDTAEPPMLPPTTAPAPEVSTTMVVEPSGTLPSTTVSMVTCPDGSPAPTYELQPGDFLDRIADEVGVTIEELVESSGLDVDDPLFPGQLLTLPCEADDPTATADECPDGTERATYTITAGESPASVAAKLDHTVAQLEVANADNPAWSTFIVGQELYLPCE